MKNSCENQLQTCGFSASIRHHVKPWCNCPICCHCEAMLMTPSTIINWNSKHW